MNASIVPVLVGSAGTRVDYDATVKGTAWQYTYIATLHENAVLTGTPDRQEYFTIYDFAGLIPGSVSVAAQETWTPHVNNRGWTPAEFTAAIADDPSVPNLTFQYSGVTTLHGNVTAERVLGAFGARSIYGPNVAEARFYSQATNAAIPSTMVQNIGWTLVPAFQEFSSDAGSSNPEPMTVVLIGGGLVAIGFLRRFRTG